MDCDRREFLKTMAVGAGVALSAGSVLGCVARATAPAGGDRRPAEERWALGVCGLCPGGCGVRGRIVGDRLVRVTGNPAHPLNRGGLCPRGCAAPQLLYHPDRLLSPLRRRGARGAGELEPVTWEAALAELVARLKESRSVVVAAPRTTGLLGPLRAAVLPDAVHLEHRPCHEPAAPHAALFLTQGLWSAPAYDLENSNFILSFDSLLLERFWRPGETARLFGSARSRGGARLVHAGSHASVTALKADEWIRIAPGTEGTLALGLAHILIKEGLVDRVFLDEQTFGYDDWQDAAGQRHEGFQAEVLKRHDPRTVSDATGVSMEALHRTARSFAGAAGAVAIGCDLPDVQSPQTRMAIHCLNALVGSIERPGGVLAPRPVREDPFAGEGGRPQRPRGTGPVLAGPAGPSADVALAAGAALPGTVILDSADVVGDSLDPQGVARTLAGAGFVVSLSVLPDATTRQADLVLPLATWMESWADAWDHAGGGQPVVSVARPMLAPLGESRAAADVWLALGAALGRALPVPSYEAAVRASFEGLYRRRRGHVFGPPHEEAWTRVLERSGWQPPTEPDFEAFWTSAVAAGGWWDPVYYHEEWTGAFATPSGRFEFFAQGLAAAAAAGGTALSADDARPRPGPAAAPQDGFPISLRVYTPGTLGGLAGRLSWLRGIAGGHLDAGWNTWVELNPATAQQLGLTAGRPARVRSPEGEFTAVVVLHPGMPPDRAAAPAGLLATDTDNRPGADPHVVFGRQPDRLTGAPRRGYARVAIEPV